MKRKVLQLFALAVAATSLFSVPIVSAASNGLGISPRKDFNIAAGSSVSDKLFISNLNNKQPLNVSLRVVDFKAQNETGTPALDLSENAPQTVWSIKPFIKLPDTVTIAAGKSTYVPFTISIPKGQGAGSYYSAIQYVAENSPTQKKVNVAASSATLVFVNVPGKATESLSLLQFGGFKASPDQQTGSFSNFFFTGQPEEVAYRVQNNGNVAEMPVGSLLVKNAFGKQVVLINNVNPKQELALRGQIRRFQICLKPETQTSTSSDGQKQTNNVCGNPKLLPGRYTALLDVFYGLSGNQQEIRATATIWYLPWWFLVGLLVVVAVVVLGVMWLYRKFTKRSHHSGR
jgi:hypothetical protein